MMGGPQPSLGLDICPAATRVTQGFGCTDYEGEWLAPWCPDGHFHAGIDLAADDIAGKPVYATRDGVIVGIEDGPHYIRLCAAMGGGLIYEPYLGYDAVCLKVDEGSRVVYIEYGHLAQRVVGPGTVVHAGQLLGYVGTHGASCLSHLHVEVRLDGPYQSVYQGVPIIDPGPYLNQELDMATLDQVYELVFRINRQVGTDDGGNFTSGGFASTLLLGNSAWQQSVDKTLAELKSAVDGLAGQGIPPANLAPIQEALTKLQSDVTAVRAKTDKDLG